MVPSKYYVYGGGRWRELDSGKGRVRGWSGAKLCVARRGRLVVQRGAARARLLAALRALAAGRPAAARLGPRLAAARKPSHTRTTRSRSRSRTCCRCCCHHNGHNSKNNNRCEGKSPPAARATAMRRARSPRSLTSDACVQTARAPPGPGPGPARLAFPAPPPPPPPRTSTPVEIDESTSSTSWKKDGDSSGDSTEPLITKTMRSPTKSNSSPIKKANLSLKRKRQVIDSETTESSIHEVSISQSILKKDFNAKYLRPRKSVKRDSPSRVSPSPPRPPRIRTRVIPGQVVHVSSDDENKDPSVDLTSLKSPQDTGTEEEGAKPSKSIDLFSQKSPKDIYRELVISEHEVEILRQFLLRTDPQFDLYRYDDDDSYKARFFYSINPLVSIEPCARIARMLEERERRSLRQFASQLGLRSVSPGRRRPRPRPRPRGTDDSEDKENLQRAVRRSRRHEPERRRLDDRDRVDNVTQMTELTITVARLEDISRESGTRTRTRRRYQDDTQKNSSNGDNIQKKNIERGSIEKKNTKSNNIQKENSESDNMQKKNSERDSIQKKNSERDSIQKKNSERDSIQKKNSESDSTQKKNNETDNIQQRKNQKDSIQKKNSEKDSIQKKNSEKDSIQKKNNESDNLKRKNKENGDNIEVNDERRKRQRKLREHEDSNSEDQRRSDAASSELPDNVVRKNVNKARVDDFRTKEYSSLEDHAIVSWISVGDRAHLVNGNRVWRSLEGQFEGVGGRYRSWHSLRNRYLRYLLPQLQALHLPGAQQARLRAAAARGEIKRKTGNTRNSIFGEPVRGASSRKPAPAPSPRDTKETENSEESSSSGSSPPPPPPARKSVRESKNAGSSSPRRAAAGAGARTPRYSDVTRQFAARHRVSSSSGFETSKSPRLRPRTPGTNSALTPGPKSPRSARTSGPRTRKLYNPNKL